MKVQNKEEEACFQQEKELSERAAAQNIELEKLKASIEEKLATAVQKEQSQNKEGTAIQNWQSAVAGAVSGLTDAMAYKRAEILNEIKFFVNSSVNKMSRIDKIEQVEAFEKTASQKIKRYLYHFANRGKKDTETPAKE